MSDGAIVAFDIGVLLRLSGLDVAQSNSLRCGPFHKLATDIFRSVIHTNGEWSASSFDDLVQAADAGPADDPDISQRVKIHKQQKDDLLARRRMVSGLARQGGMIAPDTMSGNIVKAMTAGGLFRLRDVLIGTVAFQTYAGLVGVRLPAASVLTGDTALHRIMRPVIKKNEAMP